MTDKFGNRVLRRLVTVDYGIIMRKAYPDGSIVTMAGGIHMHGTQGAAEVLLDPEFQQYVRKQRSKCFIQIVKVPVLNGIDINRREITVDPSYFFSVQKLSWKDWTPRISPISVPDVLSS